MMRVFIAFLLVVSISVGCHKVPITGRRQVKMLPESQLIGMSKTEYASFLSSSSVVENSSDALLVKKVGQKIADAVEKYMIKHHHQSRIEGFEWEFNLVQDDQVNAWCMPGGKVSVYTGILDLTKDENGLAVVLGHEVAHAIAQHGNERMSQGMLVQLGGMALDVATTNKSEETRSIFMNAYGVGAQTGIILPFSRKNELESDKLGLVFMELAGYDASLAPLFWERMAANGSSVPEFLSTHPSDETRIKEINDFLQSETFKKHSTLK